MDARTLLVATADPTREEVLDHIRVTSHCDAKFMLASPAAIERALDRAYSTPGAPTKPRDTARVPVSLDARIERLETAVTAIIDLLVGHELAEREDFPTLK
jgi:hypothetical protein